MKDEPAGNPHAQPASPSADEARPPRDESPQPGATPCDEEMGGEAPCQLHRFWDVEA